MILGFKQQFPDKTPTRFKEKILSGEKIHSIRAGDRWRPGMSIQMAYGVRTKQYEQFNALVRHELEHCKSVQQLFMTNYQWLEVFVGDRELSPPEINDLLKNDGLTRKQFYDWFFPRGKKIFSGQIVHWTDFKY